MTRPYTSDGRRARGTRLSAHAWEKAALAALASGGLAAVAVEPIARRLKVTKGSFYWHFANRDVLLRAALRRWEDASTNAIIAAVAQVGDPLRRLEALFSTVMPGAARERSLERAIFDAASHRLVGPTLRRVSRRRIDYLAECFSALGFLPEVARHRAVLTYSAYVGATRLVRDAGGAFPRGEEYARYRTHAIATLIATPAPQPHQFATTRT